MEWLKWWKAGLASVRPRVKPQYHTQKKKKKKDKGSG
jgi:hypothetical protein